MTARKAPPQPIHVSGRQARTTTSPAFGRIPTFSHRLPARKRMSTTTAGPVVSYERDEGSDEEQSDASGVDSELEAIAAAQVSQRAMARLRTRPVAAVVDIQPPTPDVEPVGLAAAARGVAAPVARPHLAGSSSLVSLKQSRRTASIYSASSSVGVVGMASSVHGQQRQPVYLRPDLSGHSGLSLDQLSHTAACEALVDGPAREEAAPRRAPKTASASVVVQMHQLASTSSLALAPPPSSDYPSQPHLSSLPFHSSKPSLPPSYPSVAVPRAAAERRETPAERLKRLYLCPWEALSPRSARRLALASPAYSEKAGPLDAGAVVAQRSAADGFSRTKRRLVVAGAVILAVVLLVDLVVLNIRIFSMRDAYYDE
ncbi:hypothetical protein JCM3775_004874 [Rhodotorula graminis]|uniref:Uncharacterized protein n=1 Tax=Rhodotorula graminis (strain WP1) TaxID=578459 RepID=A0A194S3E4_RHOGW|nr:uncharacterized protein RHOBADRAFT_44558 [Rhodotorula graminis WP1]KPV75044.1 hypothetical protein RHOBADRAFT_44558 [Rhodotorula graminis WP1]